MIQVNNLSKEFASRVLFHNVNFTVNKGEKIGLVGRNGSGKSTLFKIINNELTPDEGVISIPKNYEIATLKQYLEFSEDNIVSECMLALESEFKFETFRAEKILSGLGFNEEDFKKSPQSFSGGFQIRINLAKVLLKAPQMLLLDEPTNYLDIVSMRWLSSFLKKYPGEIILITHDRSFMKSVCNTTMGLHRQRLIKINGDFERFKNKINEDEVVYENTRLNQEKKKKEIEAFIDKFRAKARQASMAQSRQKMLDKMQEYDALEDIKNLRFKFNYKETSAKVFAEIKNLSFSYAESEKLFKNLNFFINKNEKIAIVGKNGKGKSTLLNCIAGLLNFDGKIKFHPSILIGHFGQTNINRLNDNNTIEKEIREENPLLSNTEVKNICGTMMFSGEDSEKEVKVLSGGEKSRVLLGKILAKESNLLLLDEPTNHLDQESIEKLIDEIKSFKGSSVIVTHNEYILKSLITKFIVFRKETCEVFEGTYDDFLSKIGWEEDIRQKNSVPKISKKDFNILKQKLINERSRLLKPIKKEILRLEEIIVEAESNMEMANKDLLRASEEQDSESIQKSSILLKKSQKTIEDSFLQLEKLSEEEESIKSIYEKKVLSI